MKNLERKTNEMFLIEIHNFDYNIKLNDGTKLVHLSNNI